MSKRYRLVGVAQASQHILVKKDVLQFDANKLKRNDVDLSGN